MSLRKIETVQWHCAMCNYRTEQEQHGTRCPACGHDDVLTDRDMQNEKNRRAFADWWGPQKDLDVIKWFTGKD